MVESERELDMATTQRDRYRAPAGRRMRRGLWMEGITPMWGKATQRELVAGVQVSGEGLCVLVAIGEW